MNIFKKLFGKKKKVEEKKQESWYNNAHEMAESIRFYLHSARIEAVDYEKGRENWFEFLPASRSGTIRPALVSNGKLVKKGMAAA